MKQEPKNESGGRGRKETSFLPHPLPALLLAPFFAGSLILVPRSLLLNRTETLATQAILAADVYQNRVSSVKNLEGGKQAKTETFLGIRKRRP